MALPKHLILEDGIAMLDELALVLLFFYGFAFQTAQATHGNTAPKALVLCYRQSAGCWSVDDVKPAHGQLLHRLSFLFIFHLSSCISHLHAITTWLFQFGNS